MISLFYTKKIQRINKTETLNRVSVVFKKERQVVNYIFFIALLACIFSCNDKPSEEPLFETLKSDQTGLDFTNRLTPTDSFNLFDYMYYYNGSGVGAGDFNNDGKIDLFFAANQTNNKIYLNLGDLKFRDITREAQIPQDSNWSTGVSVVDINNDGWLDIYVSRVGNYKSLHGKNQFLICQGLNQNGIPVYKDKAAEYGLDYSGFSTQAAFVDIDMDGDLDMFLLNHSVHANGVYRPRQEFLGKTHPVAGARLYRNDGTHFSDITKTSGINSSVIGYGLGIGVADINLDGFPDIYIGNDFHENDYLYINDGKGVFNEEITDRIAHTSRFSMGVDIADVNNDGYSEIISMDMLSDDPYILKRSLGEDDYDIFNLKISFGYQYQYTRNNLQYNRRNGNFTELGLYAGIAATDWSWCPLWMDFDNDGLKDLFISNGIPKRMNDIDYINFVSNEEMQKRLAPGNPMQNTLKMIEKFPKIKIPNKFFRNNGSMAFIDSKDRIGNQQETYSNGAVYADFDNDGDLDLAVSNIDEAALIYKNKTNDASQEGSRARSENQTNGNVVIKPNYLRISLTGDSANRRAIGSKLIVYSGKAVMLYEKFAVHGFQSSMDIPFHTGLGQTKIDSAILIWPDNSFQPLPTDKVNTTINLNYQQGLPRFDYIKAFHLRSVTSLPVTDATHESGVAYAHVENVFPEFNREPLIPHMLSTEGPALAVGDMNGDGLDDIFIGAARSKKPALWLQTGDGKFTSSVQPALDNDSIFEDVSACWTDVNKDGRSDLVIASGGNEFYGESENLLPRVYLNDGNTLTRKMDAFPKILMTSSVIVPADFNGDGFMDLFLGGRAMPMEYGVIPRSYLLLNDGTGKYKDVTAGNAKELAEPGFVTSAVWSDIDKDGDPDLLVSLEWGGLNAFINNKGTFIKSVLTQEQGWWNFMLPCDFDNDGDMDILAGNLGLNSRLKVSDKEPVTMYYYDFDGNGRKEQLLTYYLNKKEIPFASVAELFKQMPVIKKRYMYAGDFAKASLADIFGSESLKAAKTFRAGYFSNAVLINNGKMQFSLKALPWEGQLTSYRDAAIVNANNDSLPDVLIGGNYFDSNTEMGRYDGDLGTVLINKGKGSFSVEVLNGLKIKGQIRHIAPFNSKSNQQFFILARNNDSTVVIRLPGRKIK